MKLRKPGFKENLGDLNYNSIFQRTFFELLIPGNITVKIDSVFKGVIRNTYLTKFTGYLYYRISQKLNM